MVSVTDGIMCCQAYLNDDGSLASLVYKISCPAPQDQPDLLPAFLAELPGQNAEPGQSHASPLAAQDAARAHSCQMYCAFDRLFSGLHYQTTEVGTYSKLLQWVYKDPEPAVS